MQTDFVANVSHELRTPLTSIKATVETLRDGAMDDLAVRDLFLASIEAETDRLIRLVNDLLLLSRADSEALNLRRHAVNLTALARETLERLNLHSPNHRLNLAEGKNHLTSLAWADPDRVEQVLVNLLDNAIKYSPTGSTVTVRVNGQSDKEALIQIMDEGTGIPEEELPRIGQRFYRTDKARTRSQGGSGLGLAIAQSLVQAHGGRLWLANRQDTGGLVVSFTLPMVSPQAVEH
jgi:two-component system sensor histidine kinase VicK